MPHETDNEIGLVLITLLSVIILLIYLISVPLLQYNTIDFINERSITIVFGIGVMGLYYIKKPIEATLGIEMNSDIINSFLLPAIMFSIGYNVKRDFLFKYFKYIGLYGFFGTLLSFGLLVTLLNIGMSIGLIQEIERNDVLCLCTALNSVDFFNHNHMIEKYSLIHIKKPYAISLGECLMSTCLNLVLFQIFKGNYHLKPLWEYSDEYIITMIRMVSLFIFSVIIGGIVGLSSSLFFKRLIVFNLNRPQEVILLLLFGLFSYSLGDFLNLSPVISLLTCAFFMAHYTFYNLSFQAKEETYSTSKVIGNISEGIIYTFISVTFIYSIHKAFIYSFIVFLIISIIISRSITMVLISVIFRPKMTYRQFILLTITNMNRGFISICITLSIQSLQKDLFISSIIIIILFTNVVVCFVTYFIIEEQVDQSYIAVTKLIVSFSNSNSYLNPHIISEFNNHRIKDWIKLFWREFDNHYLKKLFVYNWPQVREDYTDLVRIIHLNFTSNLRDSLPIIPNDPIDLDKLECSVLKKQSTTSFYSNSKLRESKTFDSDL